MLLNIKQNTYEKSIIVNRIINYLLILLAFIYPISPKKITPLLILLIILWIIEGNWKNKFNVLSDSKPFKYYFAFILFMGLSLFWSDGIHGGFVKHYPSNGIVEYFKMYFLGFMLVPIMLTSMQKKYLNIIINSFLMAMFVSEIVSWGIYLDVIHLHGKISSDPSPFMNHSLYSIFLVVSVLVLITEFFEVKNLQLRIFIVIFILSSLVNLFLNGGRLGQVVFLITFFVFIFMKFKVTLRTILISILMVISIFFLAYKISPIFQYKAHDAISSIEKMFQGNFRSSWGTRAYAWIVAKDIISEHPLVGIGIGNTRKEFMEKTKEFPQGSRVIHLWHMHNQYMQILLETGIIGLIIFLLFLFYLLKIPLNKEKHILLYTFISIYLVGFIGEPLFWNRQSFMLFNFFIAIFLFYVLSANQNEAEETT